MSTTESKAAGRWQKLTPGCERCGAKYHETRLCRFPVETDADTPEGAALARRQAMIEFVNALPPRQLDVLRWVASGLSDADIALVMGVSVHTVKWYKKRVYDLLGVTTNVGATIVAFRTGLVS
jgi:DNA-binding NarL/FixJ family response regulator